MGAARVLCYRQRFVSDEIPSACPDEAALDAWIRGATVSQDATGLAAHIVGCSLCQALLSAVGSSRDDSDGPVQTRTKEPEPGDRLGRYIVRSVRGRGAMGVVLEASDPELDRRVAIKLLAPGVAASLLGREARALARLSHPNVVTVHDVGRTPFGDFVAMELVEGTTLRHWAKETQPRWRELVDVFVGAAKGLAAAHDAGIVHRDFKPDNVLIADTTGSGTRVQRRVQVADFGLAKVATFDEEPPDRLGARADASEYSTHRGGVGTPAYMARELFDGSPGDARSDQFAFGVSFYELLYGVKPFAGRSLVELIGSVRSGKLRVPTPDAGVPRWLHEVLLRTLATRPEERFASMHDVVQALLPSERRTRRTAWAIAGGVLAGAFAMWLGSAPEQCTPSPRWSIMRWSADAKAQGRSAFLETGVPGAEQTWQDVQARLDEYAESWIQARIEACEATELRKEQSPELLDRRMACLDDAADVLHTLAQRFARAKRQSVHQAPEVLEDLPPIDRCSDLEYLEAQLRPPADPNAAKRVAALRYRLKQADAALRLGDFDAAAALATDALRDAIVVGFASATAESEVLAGRVAHRTGDLEAALHHVERGYFTAKAVGHFELAAEASTLLGHLMGVPRGEHEAGLRWLKHAESEVAYLDDERLKAKVFGHRCAVLRHAGRYEDAELECKTSMTLREHIGDPLLLAEGLRGLAATELRLGRHEDAVRLYGRARQTFEDELGAGHPEVAEILSSLAQVRIHQGDYDEAERLLRRSLDITLAAHGATHPDVAASRNDLAQLLLRKRDLKAALALYRDAAKVFKAHNGPESQEYAQALSHIGLVLKDLRRFEEAEALHRQAIAIWSSRPAHPDEGLAYLNLGNVLLAREHIDEAIEAYRRAASISRERLGPEHPRVARALANEARVLRVSGDLEQAISKYRASLEVLEKALGPDHPDLGLVLSNLTIALLRHGDALAAVDAAERGFEIERKTYDRPDDPRLGPAWFTLAEAYLAAGRGDRAVDAAQHLLAARQNEPEPEARRLSEARFLLARSLAASGRRSEGRAMARRVLAELAEVGAPAADARRDVATWLAGREG